MGLAQGGCRSLLDSSVQSLPYQRHLFLREDCLSATQAAASLPWCQVLSAQPAPGTCARMASPEPGQLPLRWETEKVLNNGGLRINPRWSPRNSWLSGGAVLAAGLGVLQCLDFQCSNSTHFSKQLELPKALRKPLTSAPSPA